MFKLSFVVGMETVGLTQQLLQQVEQPPFQHPAARGLTPAFLAVRKVCTAHVTPFVPRTADAKYPTILAEMTVKPFHTFPKQFQVSGMTHVAFIAGGIGHTDVKVFQIGTPVFCKYALEGVHIQLFGQFLTDCTYYLIVGDRMGRID